MVHMSTYETLDRDEIENEYDMDEMERIESLSGSGNNDVNDNEEPNIQWDTNPAFRDISAWDLYRPDDEYLGITHHTAEEELFYGRMWPSKKEAKYSVSIYSIKRRVEYKIVKSNLNVIIFECKSVGEGCIWGVRIRKRRKQDYWSLENYKGDHTCNRTTILNDNIHLNPKVIGKHFESVLSERLRLDPLKIIADVQRDFGYQIKYLKAWQSKQIAMKNAFGCWEESFTKLPHLMEVLTERNPGTFVRWDTSMLSPSELTIDRVFWAFGPAIRAFEHCRPVLSIDGTHLHGKYNGRLLVAIGLDAANQLLPLAFALVESENNASWKWFMTCIRCGVTNRENLCVISDRHKGILSAMNTLEEWMPPRAYHRYCLRHLMSNFNQKLNNDTPLKKELGRIGYIVDPIKFEEGIKNLLECLSDRPRVRAWLANIPFEKWSLAYDEGRRWGSMTTNASECFNNILKGGRDLPICALVKFTYIQSNEYFVKRREKFLDFTSPFTPKVDSHLQELVEQAKYFR